MKGSLTGREEVSLAPAFLLDDLFLQVSDGFGMLPVELHGLRGPLGIGIPDGCRARGFGLPDGAGTGGLGFFDSSDAGDLCFLDS